MDSGIYCIINTVTKQRYIGQSVNLKLRMRRQLQQLRDGTHINSYMQRHFNKYGSENFDVKIIERCSLGLLDKRECYWIGVYETLQRDKGYNLESGGNPQKTLSKETREKKKGKNNPMYGKHWNECQREKITLANRSNSKKLNEKDVVDIKQSVFNGATLKSMAEKYNVHVSTIGKISTGKNWYWVRPDLNVYITGEKGRRYDEIVALHKQGLSGRKIREKLKTDSRTVAKALKGAGLYGNL